MSVLTLDHPSVQQVLEIAEELVRENKALKIRTIYNRAKHRLKIPKNGLLRIIEMLIDQHILINGSHFTRNLVLSHELRNYIFEIINTDLGIHFSEIKRKVDSISNTSTGQLIWHIKMLLKFNLIKKVKFKNYTIFLPIDVKDQLGVIYFLLRDDINFSILKLLSEKCFIKKSHLYDDLKEEREKLYYHLKTLKNNNIIMIKEDNISIFHGTKLQIKNVFKNMHI